MRAGHGGGGAGSGQGAGRAPGVGEPRGKGRHARPPAGQPTDVTSCCAVEELLLLQVPTASPASTHPPTHLQAWPLHVSARLQQRFHGAQVAQPGGNVQGRHACGERVGDGGAGTREATTGGRRLRRRSNDAGGAPRRPTRSIAINTIGLLLQPQQPAGPPRCPLKAHLGRPRRAWRRAAWSGP